MKQPRFLVKVATIASSVLLVAAFVSYRAGAFNWLVGTSPSEPLIMSGSKYKVLVEPGTFQEAPVEVDPVFMYSSKSIILAEPTAAKKKEPRQPATPQPPR